MLNKIDLMGRVVRDPELRQTQSGVSVCTATLAVERDFTGADNKRETDFIDIVMWRGTADFFAKYFRKGQMCAVSGNLQSRKYTDKNGNNRVAWEVQVSNVYFCGSKAESGGEGYSNGEPDYRKPELKPANEEDDGDLPF